MNTAKALEAAREMQLLNAPVTEAMFHGHSMEPLFMDGDGIVLEPVTYEEVQIGDIITYRFEDKYPTRRVVGKHDNHLRLWCDNWPERRFSANAKDILARVVSLSRDGRTISSSDRVWQEQTKKALYECKYLTSQKLYYRLRRYFLRLRSR